MKTEKWNRNNWQGRSKRQVESNEMIAFYSFAGFIITLLGIIIWDLVKNM